MTTELERIEAKDRKETNLRFTSLTHHITQELVWESLEHIPNRTSPGVDGVTAKGAKDTFKCWIDAMIGSVHRKGYHPPVVRRVYIPKPGKKARSSLCRRQSISAERVDGVIGNLRAGFSTLLVWRKTETGSAQCTGYPE